MTTPTLKSVDAAVDAALAYLKAPSERPCVAFVGPAGFGKSSALEGIRKHLGPHVALRLPQDDDGAIAALGSLADQLGGVAPALLRHANEPFSSRLNRVVELIPEEMAIVFDDPVLTARGEAWEEIFSFRARELSTRLVASKSHTRIISATNTEGLELLGARQVRVEQKAEPVAVLEAAGLASSPEVQALLDQHLTTLVKRSPIEIRLAAFIAEHQDTSSLSPSDFHLPELVRRASRRITSGMKAALARMALVREALSQEWLDWAWAGTSEADRTTIPKVFLFQAGAPNQFRLHETIAQLAAQQHWLSEPARMKAHREAAAAHKRRFDGAISAGLVTGAIRDELEVVHHKTAAGDASLLDDTIYFAEQYDLIGRSLSKDGERLFKRGQRKKSREAIQTAVTAYDRALENDAGDWYAAHYRAFNLDILGKDIIEIEKAYRHAIELRPSFVWSHSRWARFLVNTGRHLEARQALADASSELLGAGEAKGSALFKDLHLDLARQFLQFGAYHSALEVLELVPSEMRGRLERYGDLVRYAKWQEEPDRDELVFPPNVPPASRAAPLFAKQGEKVEAFMPARLAAMIGDEYRFRVRLKDGSFGWHNVDTKKLKELGLERHLPLAIGSFLEFLTVRNGSKLLERAGLHPQDGLNPFEVFEVTYPDPNRFLPT
jgi:tetratricopeptide (TPR) repeat protein